MDFETVTDAHGTTYTPWTDGWAVGFIVTNPRTGRRERVFLNPSGESDDGISNVFVYHQTITTDDDPIDGSVIYVDVLTERDDHEPA